MKKNKQISANKPSANKKIQFYDDVIRAQHVSSWNGGSCWNVWELAIGERVQLEVKHEKENMSLVDMVAIVAEVYGAVCQLYFRLWNTTLAI